MVTWRGASEVLVNHSYAYIKYIYICSFLGSLMGCAPKNAPQIWGVCNTNGWPSNDQQLFGFVPVLDHSSQLSSGYPFGHSIRTSRGSPLIEVEHMALPFVHHEVWTPSGEIQTKRLTNIQINIFQSCIWNKTVVSDHESTRFLISVLSNVFKNLLCLCKGRILGWGSASKDKP